MIGIEEQTELFRLIGKGLKKRTECFVIGGSAMLFYGMKSATKDIDIVFTEERERKQFKRLLEKAGFESAMEKVFRHSDMPENSPILMERKDIRFDLFCKEIVSTILSPGITGRIREKHEFSNLVANIISPEDIILLKCATDRAGDRKDATEIIDSMEINWDTIIGEALWQTRHGRKIFVVFLFDFMMELNEDYKIAIPKDAVRRITKIYEEKMIDFMQSKGKKRF